MSPGFLVPFNPMGPITWAARALESQRYQSGSRGQLAGSRDNGNSAQSQCGATKMKRLESKTGGWNARAR